MLHNLQPKVGNLPKRHYTEPCPSIGFRLEKGPNVQAVGRCCFHHCVDDGAGMHSLVHRGADSFLSNCKGLDGVFFQIVGDFHLVVFQKSGQISLLLMGVSICIQLVAHYCVKLGRCPASGRRFRYWDTAPTSPAGDGMSYCTAVYGPVAITVHWDKSQYLFYTI